MRSVSLSVPHAGRFYPSMLFDRARAPMEALQRLEDRYADRLILPARLQGFPVIVATYARAWIDLNRDPSEIDATMLRETADASKIAPPTDKVRGGLGLFPHRLQPYGNLWNGRFDLADFEVRLETVHAPYHAKLGAMLDQAVAGHGQALLIDVHSMPTLPGPNPAAVVIGDAHGHSLPTWLVDHIEREICLSGYRVARNAPYAGGYIINRHSARNARRYAVQLEIDRRLYLDAMGEPDPDRCRALGDMIARIATSAEVIMQQRSADIDWAQAAE